MIKSFIAATIMGIVTYSLYRFVPMRNMYTLLNVFISAVVYGLLMVVMRHPVAEDLLRREI